MPTTRKQIKKRIWNCQTKQEDGITVTETTSVVTGFLNWLDIQHWTSYDWRSVQEDILSPKTRFFQEFNLTKIDLNSPKMECLNKQIWIWQDTCSTMKSCNKSFLLHPCYALMDRRFMSKHCNLRFYFYMMLNNTHKYRLCNDERERSPSLLLWHLNWWKCQCSNELQCKQDAQCSSDVKVDTAIQCQLQYL